MVALPRVLRAAGRGAVEFLLPFHCLGCGKHGQSLCPDCIIALPRLQPPYCGRCAQPGTASPCRRCAEAPLEVDGIRAPYLMEGAIREAVHGLKYRGVRALAPELAGLLAGHLEANPVPVDTLVPVPMHPSRQRHRGYNQSLLLARELGKRTGLPVEAEVLVMDRDSGPQVSVANREERWRNAQGSFQSAGGVMGRTLLLIYYVVTTGSTMSACAQALKEGGAASVWALVLARES